MITLLVMLFGVLPWFYRTARRQGRSAAGWVVIGALSYYVPALIVGRGIMPALLDGLVTRDNMVGMILLTAAVAIGAGIVGCLVARNALVSPGVAEGPSSPE